MWLSSWFGSREPPRKHVFVVGGTGRTGRLLIDRLVADPRVQVSALVRDPDKARLTLGDALESVDVVYGDLHDVESWAGNLDGVDAVVTAVSCGLCTDPLVVLGAREEPENLPKRVDAEGVAKLTAAAEAHGVRKLVAVTTASAGSPWSLAAVFLNAYHYGSVKHKFAGEQAIRASKLDYTIIRPCGLGPDQPRAAEGAATAPAPSRGIECSQDGSAVAGGKRRRIPRAYVAALVHEALDLDEAAAQPPSRVTFECWASAQHHRPMPWARLAPDPAGPLPELNHDLPVAAALGGGALAGLGVARATWRLAGWILMAGMRRGF